MRKSESEENYIYWTQVVKSQMSIAKKLVEHEEIGEIDNAIIVLNAVKDQYDGAVRKFKIWLRENYYDINSLHDEAQKLTEAFCDTLMDLYNLQANKTLSE